LQDVCDLAFGKEYLSPKELSAKISAFQDVFSRPWFRRLWVLQEAVLVKRAILVLGNEHCELDSFRRSRWDRITSLVTYPHYPQFTAANIGAIQNLLIFRKLITLWEYRKATRLVSYEQLVYDGMLRECVDPRDHIYGLAGIAQKFGWETQHGDYTMNACDVFYTFMKVVLKKNPGAFVN
jgi:hypothetical protein